MRPASRESASCGGRALRATHMATVELKNIKKVYPYISGEQKKSKKKEEEQPKKKINLQITDEGVVAVVPVDTSIDPAKSNSYDIQTMRVGKIVQWRPRSVRVKLYNDNTGWHDEIECAKDKIAIVENPFYAVMNEPISMLKRLTKKLSLLDIVDEQNSSGKLDMIIQLPYTIKSETRQQQAEKRRQQLVDQLVESQYGIGYIDGTERITQLNRPVENQLMSQIEYYTSILYGQLGLNQDIMNGSASEDVMQNYYKRTIDVFLKAICDEFTRSFLTKTARTQGQAIRWFRDPFSLTPTSLIADIADKFTRNEILSPNEVRGVVGFMPSMDEAADELRNRNLNQSSEEITPPAMASGYENLQEPETLGMGGYPQEEVPEEEIPEEQPVEEVPEEEPIKEVPEEEIPEEEIPLSDLPEEEEEEEEELETEIPLADLPFDEEDEEFEDGEIPLSDGSPETSDESMTGLWLVIMPVSAFGAAAVLTPKKREK